MAVTSAPVPKRFTRDEFYRMAECGLLDDRSELLGGEIYLMPPIGPGHAAIGTILRRLIEPQLPPDCHVRDGVPLDLGSSQPQPDLAIVRGKPLDYLSSHPNTAFLVIEIADSSFDYDREVKAPVYAAAGIEEYWIVDLASKQVHVYRSPEGGIYRAATVAVRGTSISPVRLPGVSVAVDPITP